MRRRTSPLEYDALYRDLIAQCDDEPAQDVIAGQIWSLVQTEHATGLSMSLEADGRRGAQHVLPPAGKTAGGAWPSSRCPGTRERRRSAWRPSARRATSRRASRAPTKPTGATCCSGKRPARRSASSGTSRGPTRSVLSPAALTVFEQRPQEGDLPQQAEEYLLPASGRRRHHGLRAHQQEPATPAGTRLQRLGHAHRPFDPSVGAHVRLWRRRPVGLCRPGPGGTGRGRPRRRRRARIPKCRPLRDAAETLTT